MINQSGLNRIIVLLDDDLTYIAVGEGAAPAYGDDTLTDEAYRGPVSDSLIDGTTLVKELFLDESTANITMTEIGIFGDGASGSVNSGKLFASFGVNITKDSTQSLTLSFEIEALEVM